MAKNVMCLWYDGTAEEAASIRSLGDDVGRTELAGDLLPRLMPTHGDDAFRTHPLSREHSQQTDRAVTDHHDDIRGIAILVPHRRHDE